MFRNISILSVVIYSCVIQVMYVSGYNVDSHSYTSLPNNVVLVPAPHKFGYIRNESLHIIITLKNIPPNITVYLEYPSDDQNLVKKMKLDTDAENPSFEVYGFMYTHNISIDILLKSVTNNSCSRRLCEARAMTSPHSRENNDGYEYNDICRVLKPCVIEVDLNNECNESIYRQLLFQIGVIAVGICVLILVICISIKKCCRKKFLPVDTVELNTYSTTNQIYADLSFVSGNHRPPRHNEESTYAEIIGVLKPID